MSGRNAVNIISKQQTNNSDRKTALPNALYSLIFILGENLLFQCMEYNFSHFSDYWYAGSFAKLESQALPVWVILFLCGFLRIIWNTHEMHFEQYF